MNHLSLEISLAAVVPALVLAGYVFCRDRVEKEPLWLLALLMALGVLAYIPAYYARILVSGLVDRLFAPLATYDIQGNATFSEPWAEYAHGLLVVLLGTAAVQELLKWLAMLLPTFRSRQFNCLFDGVVYGAFTALGFGMAENLHYAWQGGWDALLLRCLTTLPGHLYCGVIMGVCYTLWRLYRTAARGEREYQRRGLIQVTKPLRSGGWFAGMLLLPMLLSGVMGFAGYFGTPLFDGVYYLLNASLFVGCMLVIRRMSGEDAYRGRYADALLDKKYPATRDLCDDLEHDGGEEASHE